MKLPEFNIRSKDMVSLLLFGGYLTVSEIQPIIKEDGTFDQIKTGPNRGNIKVKKIDIQVKIAGFGLKPLGKWKTKKEGIYQTNKDVLSSIAGEHDDQ